jgi:hypothetical protein
MSLARIGQGGLDGAEFTGHKSNAPAVLNGIGPPLNGEGYDMARYTVIAYEEAVFEGQRPEELGSSHYDSPIPVPDVDETAIVHGVDGVVKIVVKRRTFQYSEVGFIVHLYGESID